MCFIQHHLFYFLGFPRPFIRLAVAAKASSLGSGPPAAWSTPYLAASESRKLPPPRCCLLLLVRWFRDFQRVGMRTGYLVARLKFGSPGHQW